MPAYLDYFGNPIAQSGAWTNNFVATSPGATLTGTAGNDQLGDADLLQTLVGGLGDDTYVFGVTRNLAVEAPGEGIDTVIAWRDYVLTDNVENMYANGFHAAVGNSLANLIIGDGSIQTFYGMAGDDVLVGGGGPDSFAFGPGSGHDVITDFTIAGAARDTVRLYGYGFSSFAQVQGAMTQVGADVQLTLSPTDAVMFRNQTVGQFTAANFLLDLNLGSLTPTFHDEFDSFSMWSPGAPSGIWKTNFRTGNQNDASSRTLSGGTGEDQIYIDPTFAGSSGSALGLNPFSINNGALSITADRTPTSALSSLYNYGFTSGMISSEKSLAQQYGYFEIRAELPHGQGMWPGFWLMPLDGGPPPELDIMEQIGGDIVYHVAHSMAGGQLSVNGGLWGGYPTYVEGASTGFHTYGLLWTPETVTWYVDGAATFTLATAADMHQPMNMIINLAVGGAWGGNVDATSTLPNSFVIDYVRVYSLAQVESVLGFTGQTFTGGSGDDSFTVSDRHDTVVEQVGGGADTITATASYILPANVETLILAGSAVAGVGNGLANYILGTAGENGLNGGGGNDTLDGGAGVDILSGGTGDDLFYVDNSGDQIVEAPGEGLDTVIASVFYTLPLDVENLTLAGSATSGTGNLHHNVILGTANANSLNGMSGNDTLDGGAGADSLTGGSGNDLIYVDNAGDKVTELANGGSDTLSASISFTLPLQVEALILTGGALNGIGNSQANSLYGSSGDNSLSGAAGNDSLDGAGGNDTLDGGAGADSLTGGAGADLYLLRLGAGADTIQGAADGDIVDLSAYVAASLAPTLTDQGADLKLTFSNGDSLLILGFNAAYAPIDAAGKMTLSSSPVGTTGNDTLTGNAGDNSIAGLAGDDSLSGLDGADTLDGGPGLDTLAGGLGNDLFVVDSASDQVVELAGGGMDTLSASVSLTLPTGVEQLVLTGSANIDATGAAGAETLVGNTGANILAGLAGNDSLNGGAGNDCLNGGTGADTLAGGAGDDYYLVDSAGDQVIESPGDGVDTVQSSLSLTLGANLDNLILATAANTVGIGNALANAINGNSGANVLYGMAGADTLLGGAGNDSLVGGAGADVLTGGAGADRFTFAVVNDSSTNARDRITDFTPGADKIDLSGIDAINGGANDAFTLVPALTRVAGQLVVNFIVDHYEAAGDVNGDGLADVVILVTSASALTAGDFVL